MTLFFNKLMRLKKHLGWWSKNRFGNISDQVKQVEVNLLNVKQEYDQKRNKESRITLNEARAIHTQYLQRECELWCQKVAVKWIKEDDANTTYFHSIVSQRHIINFIARIRYEDDEWIDDYKGIKNSTTNFFSSLFTYDRRVQPHTFFSFRTPKTHYGRKSHFGIPSNDGISSGDSFLFGYS